MLHPLMKCFLQVSAMVSDHKPVRRERKYSTSSTASSGSTYSTPPLSAPPRRRRPPPKPPARASSAPLMTATPPNSAQQQSSLVAMEIPQAPPPHHTPLQMMQAVTLLPFLTPQQVPHPHFMYGPVPHFQLGHTHLMPRPFSQNWTGHVADTESMQTCPQPAWTDGMTGHVTGQSDGTAGHVTGQQTWTDGTAGHVIESGRGPPDSTPLPNMSGPAQGFYSFLNDQALNSDPPSYQISSSSSIWTPGPAPSASHSQGEGLGEWPQWP